MPLIVQRYDQNPIICPKDVQPSLPGMEVACLLNPGVFFFQNKIWMIVRVAERPAFEEGQINVPVMNTAGKTEILRFSENDPDLDLSDARIITYRGQGYLTTLSHLRLFSSDDGVHFTEDKERSFLHGNGDYETYGIEDCRVAFMEDAYWLTYTAVSPAGVGVGMMKTTDWQNFERFGMILPPHNKDCALFEKRINCFYYMLHRPSSVFVGGNYIWLASSPDMMHWGNHQCIATTRPGMWDSERVGAGASPILTEKGWLVIYHGANSSHRYCLGALLLDENNPSTVLARSREPLMEPVADYEKTGFFGNVVFTNGHYRNGDQLHIYYGAADEVICAATLSINEVLQTLTNQNGVE